VQIALSASPKKKVSMPNTKTASPVKELYWEDFPSGATFEFGSKQVSREEIIAFAKQFDPQDFHVNEEAAEPSPFGGLIASGWHICAMTMRMICDGFLLNTAGMGSPGVENVRWKKPVRPGDILHVRALVLESRPSSTRPEVGILRWHWKVLNQNDECVTEIESTGMFQRRLD
jgi:acyl dehydratase